MHFFRIAIVALFIVLPNHPAAAQVAPGTSPIISIEEYMKQWGYYPPQTMPHDHPKTQAPEPKFSEWGYRHRELHAKGVIAEMLERTQGKNCCNGIESGECRISKVNVRERLAFVDGEWCPMDSGTRITPLDTLTNVTDGEEEIAVVCASQSDRKVPCRGVTTYCIGIKPPKV